MSEINQYCDYTKMLKTAVRKDPTRAKQLFQELIRLIRGGLQTGIEVFQWIESSPEDASALVCAVHGVAETEQCMSPATIRDMMTLMVLPLGLEVQGLLYGKSKFLREIFSGMSAVDQTGKVPSRFAYLSNVSLKGVRGLMNVLGEQLVPNLLSQIRGKELAPYESKTQYLFLLGYQGQGVRFRIDRPPDEIDSQDITQMLLLSEAYLANKRKTDKSGYRDVIRQQELAKIDKHYVVAIQSSRKRSMTMEEILPVELFGESSSKDKERKKIADKVEQLRVSQLQSARDREAAAKQQMNQAKAQKNQAKVITAQQQKLKAQKQEAAKTKADKEKAVMAAAVEKKAKEVEKRAKEAAIRREQAATQRLKRVEEELATATGANAKNKRSQKKGAPNLERYEWEQHVFNETVDESLEVCEQNMTDQLLRAASYAIPKVIKGWLDCWESTGQRLDMQLEAGRDLRRFFQLDTQGDLAVEPMEAMELRLHALMTGTLRKLVEEKRRKGETVNIIAPLVLEAINIISEDLLDKILDHLNEEAWCAERKSDQGKSDMRVSFQPKWRLTRGHQGRTTRRQNNKKQRLCVRKTVRTPLTKIGDNNAIQATIASEWEEHYFSFTSEIANTVIDETNAVLRELYGQSAPAVTKEAMTVEVHQMIEKELQTRKKTRAGAASTTSKQGRRTKRGLPLQSQRRNNSDGVVMEPRSQSAARLVTQDEDEDADKENAGCPRVDAEKTNATCPQVPMFETNGHIVKVGIKSSYGAHQDGAGTLNSPTNGMEPRGVGEDKKGRVLPTRKEMIVPTLIMGRRGYTAKTKVDFVHKSNADSGDGWMGGFLTGRNHAHIQFFCTQHFGIRHMSETLSHTLAGSTGKRVISTHRMWCDPNLASRDYLHGIREDNLHPSKLKTRQLQPLNKYAYTGVVDSEERVPLTNPIIAELWHEDWDEEEEERKQLEEEKKKKVSRRPKKLPEPAAFEQLQKEDLDLYRRQTLNLPGEKTTCEVGIRYPTRTAGTAVPRAECGFHHTFSSKLLENAQLVEIHDRHDAPVKYQPLHTRSGRPVPAGLPMNKDEIPQDFNKFKKEVINSLDPSHIGLWHAYKNGIIKRWMKHVEFSQDFFSWCGCDTRPGSTPSSRERFRATESEMKRRYAELQKYPVIVDGSGGSTQEAGAYSLNAESGRRDHTHVTMGRRQDPSREQNTVMMDLWMQQSAVAIYFNDFGFDKDKYKGPAVICPGYYRVEGFATKNDSFQQIYEDMDCNWWKTLTYIKTNLYHLSFRKHGYIEFRLVPALSFEALKAVAENWMKPDNPYTKIVIGDDNRSRLKLPVAEVQEYALAQMKQQEDWTEEEKVLKLIQKAKIDKEMKARQKEIDKANNSELDPDEDAQDLILAALEEELHDEDDTNQGEACGDVVVPEAMLTMEDLFGCICSKEPDKIQTILSGSDEVASELEYKFSLEDLVTVNQVLSVASAKRSNKEECTVKVDEFQGKLTEAQKARKKLGVERSFAEPLVGPEAHLMPDPPRMKPTDHPNRGAGCAVSYFRHNCHELYKELSKDPLKKPELNKNKKYKGSFNDIDLKNPNNLSYVLQCLFMATTLRITGSIPMLETFQDWVSERKDWEGGGRTLPLTSDDSIEEFVEFWQVMSKKRSFVSEQHKGMIPDPLLEVEEGCKFLHSFSKQFQMDGTLAQRLKEMNREKLIKTLASCISQSGNLQDDADGDEMGIAHMALADLECIFLEVAGEVTADSVPLGPGATTGLMTIILGDEFLDKGRSKKGRLRFGVVDNYLRAHLVEQSADFLLSLGLEKGMRKDGTESVRCIHTGRWFSMIDTEHWCCKLYLAMVIAHCSRNVAETPRCHSAHCWPQPGKCKWAGEVGKQLEKMWEAYVREHRANQVKPYPEPLMFYLGRYSDNDTRSTNSKEGGKSKSNSEGDIADGCKDGSDERMDSDVGDDSSEMHLDNDDEDEDDNVANDCKEESDEEMELVDDDEDDDDDDDDDSSADDSKDGSNKEMDSDDDDDSSVGD